jgi:hypothetical protein
MPDRSLQHGGICFTIVEEKSTRYTGANTAATSGERIKGG